MPPLPISAHKFCALMRLHDLVHIGRVDSLVQDQSNAKMTAILNCSA